MSLVTCKKCEICSEGVLMDGAGSSVNLANKAVKGIIDTIYPITQKLVRMASDRHDMRYHQARADRTQKEDDDEFLKNFLDCIDDPKKLNHYADCEAIQGRKISKLNKFDLFMIKTFKNWFIVQAYKYYEAVRLFGSAARSKVPCSQLKLYDKK